MAKQHNFQVDLRGVINLLSRHLYTGPHVFIRELLQNAVDALSARRHLEPDYAGTVRLEVLPAGANGRPTLTVHDDGIGLTEEEIHKFLATIGRSAKRESLRRDDFLGQFGIGLLSGFLVSDEITVITRSVQASHPAIRWTGKADGTYSVNVLTHDLEPGTQVFLQAKPGCTDFFDSDYITRMARRFGSLLPDTIEIHSGDSITRINESAPWEQPTFSREVALEYGRRVFEQEYLDAIPIRSDAGGVRGVAYVLTHATGISSRQRHRVYLKNMLLSEQVDNLLPDWAFFVTCVVNATELQPTANREALYEDEVLAETQAVLGQSLRSYLVGLAQTDPERLRALIGRHYTAIKLLALEDDEFFRMFVDWLPFETSQGEMTLGEYCQQNPVVRYVATRDQFRQIAGVAAAQRTCIINAGYAFDRELLERLPECLPERRVELLDASELAETFEELTLDERDAAHAFLRLANLVLQPLRCSADLKKFEPAALPTLYTVSDGALFARSVEQSRDAADDLYAGVLDSLHDDPHAGTFSRLCFNHRNPLVQRLLDLENRELLRRCVETLYIQALLMGHYPLRSAEMRLLNDGLLGLIECSLGN